MLVFIFDIISFVLNLLVSIGNTVILLLRFLIKTSQAIVPTNFSKIKISFKKRRRKVIKIFPIPIKYRLKYFISGVLVSFFLLFLPILFLIFIQELPNPKSLGLKEFAQATKIYDRNGKLLYQIYATQNRTYIPLSQIPENLRNATIAIEDKNFYLNSGFDLFAIIRAVIADLRGEPLQGASTITQQLIKSTLLTPEISIERKVKEIMLSFWASRIYTKDQILEMYFNQVPYGGTSWGVEAAAQTYFGKGAADLTLSESAFLSGLPRAPSIYSPYGESPNLWKKRQIEVLRAMENQGYITREEKDAAEKEELKILPPRIPINAPHFVMYVRELLTKEYGLAAVEKGGLRVYTSLSLDIQNEAQKIVQEEVDRNAGLGISNGAALVTNPANGDILAMVGSRDYASPNDGNYNLTTAERQPGSSIKVVTYATALSKGFTAATILDDSPVSYPSASGVYKPVNYDGKFHGKVSLRLALANSFNIPAVKTLASVGVQAMVETGKKMGITTWGSPQDYGLAITLGAAEVKMTDMATVYGVLANRGERVDLSPFLKITDPEGNVLEEKKDVYKREVLDPGIAFILSDILADRKARQMEFGLNTPLNVPGKTVSVKTGTTDNKRDNWTIGYTPSFVAVVWVGNNDNSPMNQALASGITGAAPIWNRIMSYVLKDKTPETLATPENIVQKICFGRAEYFLRGTENIRCGPQPSPTTSALRENRP